MIDELCQMSLSSIWTEEIFTFFPKSESDFSQDDFPEFYELLQEIKRIKHIIKNDTDDILDGNVIIEHFNKIEQFIISFIDQQILEYVNIDIFEDCDTLDILLHFSSSIYSIEIRQASLSLISLLLYAFPIFANKLIHTRYIRNMIGVFNEFNTNRSCILLHQYIKGFANLAFFCFHENRIEELLSLINLQRFLHRAKKSLDSPSYLFIIYILSLFFNHNEIQMSIDSIEVILSALSHALAINFDVPIGKSGHLYVLNSLKVFFQSLHSQERINPEEIVYCVDQKTDLSITLDCYFDHQTGIFEKCLAASVLALLYSLNVPDKSETVFKLIPLFNEITEVECDYQIPQNELIFLLCNSLDIIIHSPNGFITLLRMYPKGLIQAVVTSIIKSSDHMIELKLIELLSSFIEINALYPPINSFFLSEGCMKLFFSTDFNLPILKSLCCIFETSKTESIVLTQLIHWFTQNGGISKLNEIISMKSPEISNYSKSILEIVLQSQVSDEKC